MKRKENDLNQTSRELCSSRYLFRGIRDHLRWDGVNEGMSCLGKDEIFQLSGKKRNVCVCVCVCFVTLFCGWVRGLVGWYVFVQENVGM